MRIIAIAASVAILAGCATSPEYTAYLQAQQDANRQAAEHQKPLVRLTAQPGQQITGLQSLEVYTPTTAPVIQQQRPNEWAAVVGQGIGVIGTIGGIHAGGKAAIGLAGEIRQAGTAGYAHIQAPGAVTTMTGSTGVLGAGAYAIDSTHAPTVVNQPAPTIVTAPDPVIVPPADPVIVPPTIVNPVVVRPEVVTQ